MCTLRDVFVQDGSRVAVVTASIYSHTADKARMKEVTDQFLDLLKKKNELIKHKTEIYIMLVENCPHSSVHGMCGVTALYMACVVSQLCTWCVV